VGLDCGPLSLVRTNEELLEKKVAAPDCEVEVLYYKVAGSRPDEIIKFYQFI
jgi:hypothetical protein